MRFSQRPSTFAMLLIGWLLLAPASALAQGSVSLEIQKTETLIAQGDYVEALATIRGAGAIAPSDYRIRYYTGMALLGLQRFDEARTETELALSLAPEEDKAGVQRLLDTIALQSVSLTAEADAEAALAAGLNGRAARLFAQAFEADSTKTEAGFRAATIYAGALGQPVEAAKILRRIEAQSPDGSARVQAKLELDKLASVVRPFVDDLLIRAMISMEDASAAANLLASASAIDPDRREVVIERLRLAAVRNDARALEAAFLGLASRNIKIESVMPVLPYGAFWAEQAWMRELLEDYQGAEYARRMLNYLRMDKYFKDCPSCPELMLIPPGKFTMGHRWEPDSWMQAAASPPREVTIGYSFAVAIDLVTWQEYQACVTEGACVERRDRYVCERSRYAMHPVCPSNVRRGETVIAFGEPPGGVEGIMGRATWEDARMYAAWLSRKTGHIYRLMSEAEWEYVARAGTTTRHYWGDHDGTRDCQTPLLNVSNPDCGTRNPWGIFDMVSHHRQWLLDCYTSYKNLPAINDGSAYMGNSCSERVYRGTVNDYGISYRWGSDADVKGGAIRLAREVPNQ